MSDKSYVPVPVKEIVAALEREADSIWTDPRWRAATRLRQINGWETRTLMCWVEIDPPPETVTADTRVNEIEAESK